MFGQGIPALSSTPSSSDELSKFCHKCKRLLPIRFYKKKGAVLKTCFECRDDCQHKKRARRRGLAEINERLIADPDLNRAVVENNNGQPFTSPYARLNTTGTCTDSISKIMQHITPVPMNKEPESPSVSVEQEDRPVEGKHIILEALDTIRKEIDKINSCIANAISDTASQKDADTNSPADDTHTPELVESDADNGIGEMTDEEGSDVSVPSYFFCMHCETPRSVGLRYDGICVYCLDQQQIFCIDGNHEADVDEFFDEYGDEHDACNCCRAASRSESF